MAGNPGSTDSRTGIGQPDAFDAALGERVEELVDVKIRACLSVRPRAVLEADPAREHFHWFNWHYTGYDRAKGDIGCANSIPCNLGEIPDYYRRFIDPPEIAVLKTCPKDEHGFYNFSLAALWHRAIVERARIVIVEECAGLPYLDGVENAVHESEVDYVIAGDDGPPHDASSWSRGYRSVTTLFAVRGPCTIRNVSRAPLSRRTRLRPTEVSRSRIVTVPAARATLSPVATTTRLPRRPRRRAGTVPVIETFPAPLTFTLTGTPREAASAFEVIFAGRLTFRAWSAAPPPGPGPGTGSEPGPGPELAGGPGSVGGGLGRNAATSAPPIDGCVPVGESTTGVLPITQGSSGVEGVPATFTPPPSLHAIVPASGASDASRANPAAGTAQSTVAGTAGGLIDPLDREEADLADRLRVAGPLPRPRLPPGARWPRRRWLRGRGRASSGLATR